MQQSYLVNSSMYFQVTDEETEAWSWGVFTKLVEAGWAQAVCP